MVRTDPVNHLLGVCRMKKQILSLVIALTITLTCIPASNLTAVAAKSFADGTYTLCSQNGLYLADINGILGTSAKIDNYGWYIRRSRDGLFDFFAENIFGRGLTFKENTLLFSEYYRGQTFYIKPNNDGSYRICPWWSTDQSRVVTENGSKQPTIQPYTGAKSQRWNFKSISINNEYEIFMYIAIGTTNKKIITHNAKNQTDASLKKLIAKNSDKYNMVEGEHVVLHLPNEIWAKYSDPKKLIDTYDAIYRSQLEFIGGKAKIYNGKLYFLTDYNPRAPYMYMTTDSCASSLAATENNANFWVAGRRIDALWGVGHEIGHAMVNKGMGNLFEGYDGESWNQVLTVYALGQLGLKKEARLFVSKFSHQYNGDNNKYSRYEGKDYDTLSDSERNKDILAVNTHIFVKLPMLLVDNYGWKGMRKFFTQAAKDHAGGINASTNIQARIDYMVVNLSKAYNMDLSMLFDYWKVSPSTSAKSKIANLPKERIIAASYSLPLR